MTRLPAPIIRHVGTDVDVADTSPPTAWGWVNWRGTRMRHYFDGESRSICGSVEFWPRQISYDGSELIEFPQTSGTRYPMCVKCDRMLRRRETA